MKKLALCLALVTVFLSMACIAGAQKSLGRGQLSGEAPSELCNAIEQYVAQIDATRAIRDKARREAKYTEAQKELAPVLKQYDKVQMLDAAASYAHYSELVLTTDPADVSFSDNVDKRLKSRTDLMEPCAPFTTQR
ncbi:MAG: hypothetical protein HY912_09410 [Desulfomonile tiedjei]|uniref:Uncharacterized protein n=1 Tax=Desulfomonile tiedjei TaxID=2358 RepID=A0A9D6V2X9_9BACT|nr:hypothetical protein [Desulfomonile tiedjei]